MLKEKNKTFCTIKLLVLGRIGAALASGALLLIVGGVSDVYRFGTRRFVILSLVCCVLAGLFYLLLAFEKPARAMTDFTDKFAGKAALFASMGYCIFMGAAVVILYKQFDPWIDFDLALRNQAFWRLLHGAGFVSTMDSGINNLGIHSAYVYFLIAPVYALFPFPPTLMVCQAAAIALGGYLLYRCLAYRFSSEIAIGAALSYGMTAMVSASVFHGVHEVTYGLPIFVLMYDSFLKGKLIRFLGWTAAMLTVKETMPAIVAGFAVLAMVKKYPWKWAVLPIILALIFAIINFGLVFPMLRSHMANVYMGLDFLPKSLDEWLGMSRIKLRYALALLAPFLFLGPARAYSLPALSEIGINLISMNPCHTDLNRHYALFIAVAFLVSSAFAIKAWSNSAFLCKIAGNSRRASLWLVLLLLLSQAIIAPLWTNRLPSRSKGAMKKEWAMVNLVPAKACVIASHGFLSALSSRGKLYSFYNTFDKFPLCDFLMIDGSFIPEWYPVEVRRKLTAFTENPRSDPLFEPLAVDGKYMLLQRKSPGPKPGR